MAENFRKEMDNNQIVEIPRRDDGYIVNLLEIDRNGVGYYSYITGSNDDYEMFCSMDNRLTSTYLQSIQEIASVQWIDVRDKAVRIVTHTHLKDYADYEGA